jgi:hypothetical protein
MLICVCSAKYVVRRGRGGQRGWKGLGFNGCAEIASPLAASGCNYWLTVNQGLSIPYALTTAASKEGVLMD